MHIYIQRQDGKIAQVELIAVGSDDDADDEYWLAHVASIRWVRE